jgi:hypothetical protein
MVPERIDAFPSPGHQGENQTSVRKFECKMRNIN